MMFIKMDHIAFVPPAMVKNSDDKKYIYVFSHKYNNLIYKKKNIMVGVIFIQNATKKPSFSMVENACLSAETMIIIASFLHRLELGKVKYDFEKGEFLSNEK